MTRVIIAVNDSFIYIYCWVTRDVEQYLFQILALYFPCTPIGSLYASFPSNWASNSNLSYLFHLVRCTCSNCSVDFACKLEECICCREIDRCGEVMGTFNKKTICITLHQSISKSCGIAFQSCDFTFQLFARPAILSSNRILLCYLQKIETNAIG